VATGVRTGYNFRMSSVCAKYTREGVVLLGGCGRLTALAEEAEELPEGANSGAGVLSVYAERYPKRWWISEFDGGITEPGVCGLGYAGLRAGDEIAFLPPVSGG